VIYRCFLPGSMRVVSFWNLPVGKRRLFIAGHRATCYRTILSQSTNNHCDKIATIQVSLALRGRPALVCRRMVATPASSPRGGWAVPPEMCRGGCRGSRGNRPKVSTLSVTCS